MTTIAKGELHKLVALYRKAENTPIIAMTVKDGLEGNDFASLAWKDVMRYYDELAKKYNFNVKEYAIDQTTGEIKKIGLF